MKCSSWDNVRVEKWIKALAIKFLHNHKTNTALGFDALEQYITTFFSHLLSQDFKEKVKINLLSH